MAALTPSPISMRERLRTDYHWTARQRQVLELIARGKTNGEIADALGLQLSGVKWHVSEIMSKLQAESREEAAEYWRRYNGLAPRFERVFRGLGTVTAGTASWVLVGGAAIGLAVGTVVAIAVSRHPDRDLQPSVESSGAVASPTPFAVPDVTFSEYRAKPRPEIQVAGITIGPGVPAPAPSECQPGQAESIPAADARDTLVDMETGALPPGARVDVAQAVSCAGTVVSLNLDLAVDPDRAVAGHGGGPVMAFRILPQSPTRPTDIPAEYWREATIASQTVAMAAVRVDGRYLVEIAIWDEQAGLLSWVVADFLPPDVVVRIAEALFSRLSPAAPFAATPGTELPFRGTIAGIEIVERTRDVSPFELCPGTGLEPLTVPEATALADGDTAWAVPVSRMPSGVSVAEGIAADVFVCGDEPKQMSRTFSVASGTADVNRAGGTVIVSRLGGYPQLASNEPLSHIHEVSVGVGTGIVIESETGSRGAGCEAAVWDEASGIFTTIEALTGDWPFCERVLRSMFE
jgi:DNA-binding CsgD family transcriptional regulator